MSPVTATLLPHPQTSSIAISFPSPFQFRTLLFIHVCCRNYILLTPSFFFFNHSQSRFRQRQHPMCLQHSGFLGGGGCSSLACKVLIPWPGTESRPSVKSRVLTTGPSGKPLSATGPQGLESEVGPVSPPPTINPPPTHTHTPSLSTVWKLTPSSPYFPLSCGASDQTWYQQK